MNGREELIEESAPSGAQRAKILDAAVDELGVYAGDEDGDYWTGYRDGQRRQIHVLKTLASEARAVDPEPWVDQDGNRWSDAKKDGYLTHGPSTFSWERRPREGSN